MLSLVDILLTVVLFAVVIAWIALDVRGQL